MEWKWHLPLIHLAFKWHTSFHYCLVSMHTSKPMYITPLVEKSIDHILVMITVFSFELGNSDVLFKSFIQLSKLYKARASEVEVRIAIWTRAPWTCNVDGARTWDPWTSEFMNAFNKSNTTMKLWFKVAKFFSKVSYYATRPLKSLRSRNPWSARSGM